MMRLGELVRKYDSGVCKSAFLIVITVLFSVLILDSLIQAQDKDPVAESTELQVALDKFIDEQYIRIPKKDFDILIDNKVTSEINSKITTIIGFIVALIGVLSALSIFQTNRTRDLLKAQVDVEMSKFLGEAKGEIRKYYEDQLDHRIDEINDRLNKSFNETRQERNESLKEIQKQINQAQQQIDRSEDYLMNVEYEELYDKIVVKASTVENIEGRTLRLLEDAEAKGKTQLMPGIINLLSFIYYDLRKYNDVTQLISKYEDSFKLKSTSYVNAALTALNDYHLYNSLTQRNKAIEYLDKSLELTRGYGEAQALKLEIYGMDYLRNNLVEPKKEQALKAGKVVFSEILNSESYAPAYETVNRLEGDRKNIDYKKYIDVIYDIFSHEMEELFLKADDQHGRNEKESGYEDGGNTTDNFTDNV